MEALPRKKGVTGLRRIQRRRLAGEVFQEESEHDEVIDSPIIMGTYYSARRSKSGLSVLGRGRHGS